MAHTNLPQDWADVPAADAVPAATQEAAPANDKLPMKDRPPFAREMCERLIWARSITGLINDAAPNLGDTDNLIGAAWCVEKLLRQVEEYVDTSYNTLGD